MQGIGHRNWVTEIGSQQITVYGMQATDCTATYKKCCLECLLQGINYLTAANYLIHSISITKIKIKNHSLNKPNHVNLTGFFFEFCRTNIFVEQNL